ncbi:uncharacterized protein LOC135222366 [Macrobrachium nipponense]|uniref:uncharacterized protein LOC135222366 n=1 Tax=Macrobrachium nipponense TaxID=159736 RepID=UPI0030C7CC0C
MVERLMPMLKKKDTKMRFTQEVGLKLAVTLRHLASGNDYTSLQYSFRISKSSICRFIPLVCQAIIDTYKPEVMKCPKAPEEWNNVAKRFASKWNYFNCVGALDGKHITIKKPKGGGSLYINYKKFHSIVLMALSNAKYRFLFVDVGAGGAGDGRTWQKCNNRAGLPQDRNHRSSACRVVENAVGLLQMRWRVFGTMMQQDVQAQWNGKSEWCFLEDDQLLTSIEETKELCNKT